MLFTLVIIGTVLIITGVDVVVVIHGWANTRVLTMALPLTIVLTFTGFVAIVCLCSHNFSNTTTTTASYRLWSG
jgi:hypothetical protein